VRSSLAGGGCGLGCLLRGIIFVFCWVREEWGRLGPLGGRKREWAGI
jgi:hypothetical protein